MLTDHTLSRIIRVVTLLALLPLLLASSAWADTFGTLRANFVYTQTGPTASPSSNVAAAQTHLGTVGLGWSGSMETSGTRMELWSDLSSLSTNSGNMDGSFARLLSMAQAYAIPNDGLSDTQKAAVLVNLQDGLSWLCTHYYNSTNGKSEYDNWYDWEIGSAKSLGYASLLIYDQLSTSNRALYASTIEFFDPNPSKCIKQETTCTGANLADVSTALMLAGALNSESSTIQTGVTALSPLFVFVTSTDGFYQDGSFVQHTGVAYTAHYGSVLLGDLGVLLYALNGTAWPITDTNVTNTYNWPIHSFAPLYFQGAVMDMTNGRFIGEPGQSDHGNGKYILSEMAQVALAAPAATRTSIGGFCKLQVAVDPASNFFSGPGPFQVYALESLVNDNSIPQSTPASATYTLAGMQRTVSKRPTFAFGLATFSRKISSFEAGDANSGGAYNQKGWFTGAGSTFLYTGDQGQYDNHYYPTVNLFRFPGTTTDGSNSNVDATGFKQYLNGTTDGTLTQWVGGSNTDGYGSQGMQFSLGQLTGSTLAGYKSWFFFDNKMVALGAGITSTSSGNVETIIDNRQLTAAGTNTLNVNTTTSQLTSLGSSSTFSNVSWAWLDGNVTNSGIGYYFPGKATVYALRESRTGSYNDISPGQSTTDYTNNFLSLAFEHGATPANASYAYAVLPNQTESSIASYSTSPDFLVLSNTTSLQAVKDTAVNVTGASFWPSSGGTLRDENGQWLVIPNKAASTTTKETATTFDLGVSDPTQSNTSIEIHINRTATVMPPSDPPFTVKQISPFISVTVDTTNTVGRSLPISFTIKPATGLAFDTADAYVQDGTADQGTNYGGSDILYVKTDSVGYDRNTYLKFDVSQFSGAIYSAKLTLTPTLVGQTGITNVAYAVSNTTWTESGITFSNSPAIGSQITSWTVPAVGTPVVIDLTAQAQAAQAGNGLFSIAIEAPAGQGSNSFVEYGSKENATTANQPVFTVTR